MKEHTIIKNTMEKIITPITPITMKLPRYRAVQMYKTLSSMSFECMTADTISAILDNFDCFRRIHDEYLNLANEVSRRLYEAMNQERKKDFFCLVAKYEHEMDNSVKARYKNEMELSFPDFCPLYEKHLAVLAQLFGREVDIDVVKIDRPSFVRGAMLGNPRQTVESIETIFGPILNDRSDSEQDYTELEKIL